MTLLLTLFLDEALAVLRGYVKLAQSSEQVGPTMVHYVLVKSYMLCMLGLKAAHGIAKSRCSKKVLDTWIGIGADLNIVPLLSIAGDARKLLNLAPWKACHFSRCVCNDMRPCHKLKVCRGCWTVKYCCTECQKR